MEKIRLTNEMIQELQENYNIDNDSVEHFDNTRNRLFSDFLSASQYFD